MKRSLIIGVLAIAMGVAGTAHAAVKLAYVDVQRALNDCNAGRHAKVAFRAQIQQIETKLQDQQNSISALKDELEKKGMLMKADERQNLQDEYARKLRNFENSYKDSKAELQEKDNEMTSKIVRDLATVIRRIGERGGYTLVLEKGSILWGTPGIDITDQVIRDYNNYHGQPGMLAGVTPPSNAGSSIGRGLSIQGGSGEVLQKGAGGGSTITR